MSAVASGTVIAGLGNVLLRDDGVGVHAVRRLSNSALSGVTMIEIGTAVLAAVPILEDIQRLIVIDALLGGGAPGTIYCAKCNQLEEPQTPLSLHQLGLLSAFRLLPRATPPETYIIGVEPEVIDYGLELSLPVAAVLPEVAALACKLAGTTFDIESIMTGVL
jgi:hydrogenase maturation protease